MGRLFNKDEKFFISPNLPNDGGKLHFTETGTSTLLATFSNKALSAANVNPIILNSDGKLPVDVFLDPSLYRMRVTDSADIQISLTDNVSAIISAGDTQQDLRTTGTVVMSGTDPITIGGTGTNTLNGDWVSAFDITLTAGKLTITNNTNENTLVVKNSVSAFSNSLFAGDTTRASSTLFDLLRLRTDVDGTPVEAFRVLGDGSLSMVGDLSISNGAIKATEGVTASQAPGDFTQSIATSTNFHKIIELNGNAIYISDGTAAEGNLLGQVGDLCLNGGTANGQLAWCDTFGTNWTDA